MTADIRIEWSRDDGMWFAGFLRDGESFTMDGKLAGGGGTPNEAVWDLWAEAHYLVLHGENAISEGQISLSDRVWLFKMLDQDVRENEERYKAMREALGHDPYQPEPPLPQLSVVDDRAIEESVDG